MMLEHVGEDVVVGVCSGRGGNQQGCGENDPFHDNSSMLGDICLAIGRIRRTPRFTPPRLQIGKMRAQCRHQRMFDAADFRAGPRRMG
jgi:hypothetical protein